MRVTFYGGTGSVTGANFLIETAAVGGAKKPFRMLVDCGMQQGSEEAEAFNKRPFPYDPASIDVLIITHAHIDHVGRIPKLVKDGFRGAIFSTPPTRDIAALLLADTLGIMEYESRKLHTEPLFGTEDVAMAARLWQTLPYHEAHELAPGVTLTLRDSGHILGSSMAFIEADGVAALFTGDLGNSPSLILPDTDSAAGADYIVMESVYGDRNHESKEERQRKLRAIIAETIAEKRLLIIPAFSVERTQQILFEMNDFFENGLPQIPVFLDSPLAIKVTDLYETYSSYLKPEVQAEVSRGEDVFKFPKLHSTMFSRQSERIDKTPNPKIIMAGSGMSSGGRIVHHEKDHAGDKDATILLVGYQAAGTVGRQLEDGAKEVRIDGETVAVQAKVEMIEGYSSHKDSDHLVGFVEDAAKTGKLKKVFTVMGEPKSSLFLVQRLRDELGVKAEYPEYGESVTLA